MDLREQDKRQRTDLALNLDYSNSRFYVKPCFRRSLEELVGLEKSDSLTDYGVYGTMGGGFHVPFFGDDEGKYVARKNVMNLEVGYKDSLYVKPVVKLEVDYSEYDFEDYDFDSYSSGAGFSRTKSALSNLYMNMSIPVKFGRIV